MVTSDVGKISKVEVNGNVVTFHPQNKILTAEDHNKPEMVDCDYGLLTYRIPEQFDKDFIKSERGGNMFIALGDDKFEIKNQETAKKFVKLAKEWVNKNFSSKTEAEKVHIFNCILMNSSQTSMRESVAMLTESFDLIPMYYQEHYPELYHYKEQSWCDERQSSFTFTKTEDGNLNCAIKVKYLYKDTDHQSKENYHFDSKIDVEYSEFGAMAADGSDIAWRSQCIHRDPATLTVINP